MRFPYINVINKAKEMTSVFGGYFHKVTCQEGQFYDTKNMSTIDFPFISTRPLRAKSKQFTNPQGFLDKESLVWVDGSTLYVDNVAVQGLTLSTDTSMCPKSLYKMGAFILIFPDKKWYNTKDSTYGNMEASQAYTSTSITMTQVNAKGQNITIDGQQVDGHYKLETRDGKTSLMVYSATASMWMNVSTVYFKIAATNIGANFNKGDGVKITVNMTGISWDRGKDIFVNDEGNNVRSSNFVIYEMDANYIIVVGLLDQATRTFTFPSFKVERKTPDMAYICECQNRLWGCSKDGHEIYASKLGDATNWNCFAGISTDSWAATVGSDGVFTGAFAYMGYPIFFKEESLLKISISAYGAHSYKETVCRGVQDGSSKSLNQLNELLYYKSTDGVCVYDGNFPMTISDALGVGRYSDAISGSINDRYYISMKDENNEWHLFVYDSNNNIWTREDNTHPKFMVRHDEDLFYIGQDNYLHSMYGTKLYVTGTDEKNISWYVESGNIGYNLPDRKYLSRLIIRMSLEVGSFAKIYVGYDNFNKWEFAYDISGKGIRSLAIPIRPHRCDHFRLKIVGEGSAKLISLTKEYEEGSDV